MGTSAVLKTPPCPVGKSSCGLGDRSRNVPIILLLALALASVSSHGALAQGGDSFWNGIMSGCAEAYVSWVIRVTTIFGICVVIGIAWECIRRYSTHRDFGSRKGISRFIIHFVVVVPTMFCGFALILRFIYC